MVLQATPAATPALTAIKSFSGSQTALQAIEQDKTLLLQMEVDVAQSGKLNGVEGWTYLQLFGKDPEAEPFATITDTIDTAKLGGWAENLATAQITIWMNQTMISSSPTGQARQGRMIGIALHEWELHARALYDLYQELRGVQNATSPSAAAKALEALTTYVKAGVYSARSQHSAPELRQAQMLTAFRLACAKVAADMRGTGGKRKEAEAQLDAGSFEYAALITTRRDVLDQGTGLSLAKAKGAYAGALDGLRTKYGKDVVDEVVSQFEMDDD